MSVELLYTSAAQGLKQGSRGFCTVISTAGMPINLATRLEGLSAYRHQFPPNHPDANQNPVCFSHLRFSIGGRHVSILSRISDYGIDYSQRTNKLAHHVVLDAQELTPAGPAWLMEHGKIFRDAWSGQCETPATGPAIAMQNQSPRVCLEWGHRCGDAGWGGVVADAFMQAGSKTLWIVYGLSQSQQLLRLLSESIALLPVDQRWRATFSTYATNLPPDADCKVRCVLQGTDEARLAPARGAVIDLTKPLPAPPATANVTAAREGPEMRQLPAAASPPIAPPNKKLPAASPSRPQAVPPSVAGDNELNQADDSLQLASLPSLPPTIKPKQFRGKSAAASDDSTANTRWLKWALVAASVAAVLMLITTIALLVRPTQTSVGEESIRILAAAADADGSQTAGAGAKSTQAAGASESNQTAATDGVGAQAAAVVPDDPQTAAVVPDDPQAAAVVPDDPQAAAVVPDDPQTAAVVPDDPQAATVVPDDPQAGQTNSAAIRVLPEMNGSAIDALKNAVVDGGEGDGKQKPQIAGKLVASKLFNDGQIWVTVDVPLEKSLVGGKYYITATGSRWAAKQAGRLDSMGTVNSMLKQVIALDRAALRGTFWLQGVLPICTVAANVKSSTEDYKSAVDNWNMFFPKQHRWIITYTEIESRTTMETCVTGFENLHKLIVERVDEVEANKKLVLKKLENASDSEKQQALQSEKFPDIEDLLKKIIEAEANLASHLRSLNVKTTFETKPIIYLESTTDDPLARPAVEATVVIQHAFPFAEALGNKMPPANAETK